MLTKEGQLSVDIITILPAFACRVCIHNIYIQCTVCGGFLFYLISKFSWNYD